MRCVVYSVSHTRFAVLCAVLIIHDALCGVQHACVGRTACGCGWCWVWAPRSPSSASAARPPSSPVGGSHPLTWPAGTRLSLPPGTRLSLPPPGTRPSLPPPGRARRLTPLWTRCDVTIPGTGDTRRWHCHRLELITTKLWFRTRQRRLRV